MLGTVDYDSADAVVQRTLAPLLQRLSQPNATSL